MGSVRLDDRRLPLIVVTFDGLLSDAEFDDYLERMSQLLQRKTKSVTILDARRAERAPPTQRRAQAEWLKRHDAELRLYSAGTAFVIDNLLVRGVATAIFWVQPLPTPHTIVATMTEAEASARQQLSAAGIAIA